MPSPSVAWRTSSPTESAGIGRSGVAAPAAAGRDQPVSRWRSISPCGSSDRNRDGRLYPRAPKIVRRVRVRQREPLAGAGHPDVAEPPLLVLGVLLERALVREEPLLHADHEDDRELEPLGVVQRHQGDVRALDVERVLVGEERDLLEERVERGLLLAPFLVLARDPDQLLEVLDPALRLERALGLEHVHVAARREHLLEQGRGPRLGRLGPQVVHQRRELAHLPRGGRRERHRRRVLDGLHERPAHVGRVLRQPLEGRLADPPPRAVHDPPERHLVGRVGDHLEIGDRILHLGPLVEARAADHAVRHALADEQILEHARLRIDPVEDGDVGRARTAVDRLGDLAGDEPRLGMLVVGLDDPHRHAAAELRPEPLRLAVGVAVDDRVRGVENRLRRAVVLLERDDVGAREVVLELGDVSDVGAPEGVDRLILVADDRDVPVALRAGATRAGTGRGSCPGTRRP